MRQLFALHWSTASGFILFLVTDTGVFQLTWQSVGQSVYLSLCPIRHSALWRRLEIHSCILHSIGHWSLGIAPRLITSPCTILGLPICDDHPWSQISISAFKWHPGFSFAIIVDYYICHYHRLYAVIIDAKISTFVSLRTQISASRLESRPSGPIPAFIHHDSSILSKSWLVLRGCSPAYISCPYTPN